MPLLNKELKEVLCSRWTFLYIYIYTYIYTHAHIHVCIYIYPHKHTSKHAHVHVHRRICIAWSRVFSPGSKSYINIGDSAPRLGIVRVFRAWALVWGLGLRADRVKLYTSTALERNEALVGPKFLRTGMATRKVVRRPRSSAQLRSLFGSVFRV